MNALGPCGKLSQPAEEGVMGLRRSRASCKPVRIRKMRWRSNELAFCVVLLCAGCGGAPPDAVLDGSFPEAPYAVVFSDEKRLFIEVRTSPGQPPRRGHAAVQLAVKDEQNAPVDGLTVQATPWMPAMGHGAPVDPMVSAIGEGKYVVQNVSMFMPGRWELHTTFSGPVADTAMPVFDVP